MIEACGSPAPTEPPAVPRVVAISTTAVKGLALETPQSVDVGPDGVAADRAFFLVDANGVMINGKALGELVRVRAEVADDLSELTLRFPDATEVRGAVVLGAPRMVQFFRARFAAPVGPRPVGRRALGVLRAPDRALPRARRAARG